MILLADIGGSHIRYTFYEKGKLKSIVVEDCDAYKTPLDFLDQLYQKVKFTSAFLAVAGPIEKGKVVWTNRLNWSLSEAVLKKRYHLKKVALYNDVFAQGWGLNIKSKKALLLNVGTGFGSCLIDNGVVFPCEFGQTLDENNQKKERILSGSGIVKLYHQQGGDKKITSAKKIDEFRKQKNKQAQKAYQLFYQLWGKTAANIATGLMVKEGVYLWGGLAPQNKEDMNTFLKSFYHKNYPAFTHKIPVKIVKSNSLTIKGLMNLIKGESD